MYAQSPVLCIVVVDIDHGTLNIFQFCAVSPHRHLEQQNDTDTPDIIQRQIKVTVAAPPSGIVEWPGRYEEDIVHPSLAAVNGSERLTVHKLLSQVVCVANVQP